MRRIDVVSLVEAFDRLDVGGPRGLLAIVAARFADSDDVEHYHVPLSLRWSTSDGTDVLARFGGFVVRDGTADPDMTSALLDVIASNHTANGLRCRTEPRSGLLPGLGLVARELGAEQSNTSVVLGERYILKLFRRLAAGLNPDLEVHRALGRAGSGHIAPVLGAIEGELAGTTTTLGVLHPFMADAVEGWDLATRLAGADQDFTAHAEELGGTVAITHRQLAIAFGTSTMDGSALGLLSRDMLFRLEEAVRAVPLLSTEAAQVRAAFTAVADLSPGQRVHRVHGDLHLGQVLRTGDRWLLIDFEGEPSASLAQRRVFHSPLRDVAGMLRSFDYATAHAGGTTEWAAAARTAFLDGYAEASGIDLAAQATLLTAYELDKAVYEVVYETRNRPDWVGIPLRALQVLG
ncbi:maltokinase [Saccharothrix tamanrassetensis]|uniref:Maltokinase n=1 Tax=Saccharothrix tamanrassetensis TaxID=1051531 RepID=A0A841CBJ9_9PSEU|nr:phosphotransferase [Saccharothrix tamanrassetensis]MBB5954360.1 maltokinase [Saccharothrix tamanrassetensis]